MEGRLNRETLCGAVAALALVAGALAFVAPIASLAAGVLAAMVGGVALVAGRERPTDEDLVEKAKAHAQQGRQLAIFERETSLLAHWYLTLRGQEECVRAQRYGRELTVVVVEPQSGPQEWAIQGAMTDWLRRNTRHTDLVGYLGNGRFVALLTDTDLPHSERLITRLSEAIPTLEVGTASFPADGATFEELLSRAEQMLQVTARVKESDGPAAADSVA